MHGLARALFSPKLVVLILIGFAVVGLGRIINWDYLAAMDFGAVWQFRMTFLFGLLGTLGFTATGVILGILFGTILATLSQSPIRAIRWLITAHVELWRNTPLLVQLFWIHFALPFVTGINTSPNQSGLIAITLNTSAYYTEIVRGGIEAVPRGQWAAAYALGLSAWVRWRHVILPQAFRIMLPPMANLMISIFKATAILSVLSVAELMRTTVRVTNFTFKPFETYTVAAVLYVVVGLLLSHLARQIEQRGRVSEREP